MRIHLVAMQMELHPAIKWSVSTSRYASDPNWGSKIAGHMWRIDMHLGKKDYQQADLGQISYDGSVGVNVRTSPSATSPKLFSYHQKDPGLNAAFGYPVVIVDETTGSDGHQWYKVISDMNPPADYGWIRSDLVERISIKLHPVHFQWTGFFIFIQRELPPL